MDYTNKEAEADIKDILIRCDEDTQDCIQGIINFDHYLRPSETLGQLYNRLEYSFANCIEMLNSLLIDGNLKGVDYVQVVYGKIKDFDKAFRSVFANIDHVFDERFSKALELERSKDFDEAEALYLSNINDCCQKTNSFDRLCKLYRRQKRYEDLLMIINHYLDINRKSKTFKDRKKAVQTLIKENK